MVPDSRKQSEGLVISVLVSAVRVNEASRSIMELLFFLFPKPKRRLEDCKAWIRACGRPMANTHGLPSNLAMEVEAVTHAIQWLAPSVTHKLHMPSFSQTQ